MNGNQITQSILFNKMTTEEFELAKIGLAFKKKKYKKNSTILSAGSKTINMGFVLLGSVRIESNDIWGNRTILSHVAMNQFFAETYAYLLDEPMLVDVIANEDCEVLFMDLSSIKQATSINETWKVKFISSLLTISSRKNLALSGRSFHTAPKTIRARVMSYLNSVALKKGSQEFDIPFDRQQLADYLNIERTALSKELGKMQNDGLISVHKNHFAILT
jgi:CRP-like cAMP-binding protein